MGATNPLRGSDQAADRQSPGPYPFPAAMTSGVGSPLLALPTASLSQVGKNIFLCLDQILEHSFRRTKGVDNGIDCERTHEKTRILSQIAFHRQFVGLQNPVLQGDHRPHGMAGGGDRPGDRLG